jgi:hypothetical protein
MSAGSGEAVGRRPASWRETAVRLPATGSALFSCSVRTALSGAGVAVAPGKVGTDDTVWRLGKASDPCPPVGGSSVEVAGGAGSVVRWPCRRGSALEVVGTGADPPTAGSSRVGKIKSSGAVCPCGGAAVPCPPSVLVLRLAKLGASSLLGTAPAGGTTVTKESVAGRGEGAIVGFARRGVLTSFTTLAAIPMPAPSRQPRKNFLTRALLRRRAALRWKTTTSRSRPPSGTSSSTRIRLFTSTPTRLYSRESSRSIEHSRAS